MSATDWHEGDYARVAAILAGATLTGGSANFLGVYDTNAWPPGADPPQAVTSPDDPTIFAVWGIDYQGEPSLVMDRTAEPVRRGVIAFEAWVQTGVGIGPILDLFTEAKAAFTGTASPNHGFLPAAAAREYLGVQGDFAGWRLNIPFWGGATE